MGKHDNRKSMKMRRRSAQKKKLERAKKRKAERKAARPAAAKGEFVRELTALLDRDSFTAEAADTSLARFAGEGGHTAVGVQDLDAADALGDHGTQPGEIHELAQLEPVRRRAACRAERVAQPDGAEAGRQVRHRIASPGIPVPSRQTSPNVPSALGQAHPAQSPTPQAMFSSSENRVDATRPRATSWTARIIGHGPQATRSAAWRPVGSPNVKA
jgi:hypothetical protein